MGIELISSLIRGRNSTIPPNKHFTLRTKNTYLAYMSLYECYILRAGSINLVYKFV